MPFWRFLYASVNEWLDDRALRHAAGLAFYSIFSMAPLLVISIALAGFVFGEAAVQGEIVAQIEDIVGLEGAIFLEDMLRTVREQESGILATIIGLVTVFVGAIAVFNALQDALNMIWRVQSDSDLGILYTVRRRLVAFSMIIVFGLMLLVSIAASTSLAALQSYSLHLIEAPWYLWRTLDLLVWFGFFMVLFAMIYKLLPDVEIVWKDVWIGSAMTSLLFGLGKFAISTYLARSSVGSIFGAAGTFVVILMWIYYSWAIVLFGAEMTQVYARRFGSGIEPSKRALRRRGPGPDEALRTKVDEIVEPG
ncbi:MAG: YihY/virulence factor BrkB family protein [Bradymonadaceae bacterium]|nr:YihY/virulence factor BrkB family protein [Lujinxingiaceae bacterium]